MYSTARLAPAQQVRVDFSEKEIIASTKLVEILAVSCCSLASSSRCYSQSSLMRLENYSGKYKMIAQGLNWPTLKKVLELYNGQSNSAITSKVTTMATRKPS